MQMATPTRSSARGHEAGLFGPGWGSRAVGGRARVPYLVLGALLVLGCTAAVVGIVMTVGGRSPAWVLARPVIAGHLLAAADVRSVAVRADPGLDLLPGEDSAVVGRPVAYSLPAGVVLTRGVLGPARVPPPGLSVVAVAADPGRYPPELGVGSSVLLVPVADSTTSNSPAVLDGPWPGVVVGLVRPGADQAAVISVQMPAAAARQVAAIPSGQLSVVTETGGH